jgi:hypothetical protein
MTQVSLNIPDPLYSKIQELAQQGNTSLSQFIVAAVVEKASAADTERFFQERAQRGDSARFLEIMDRVPDAPPMPGDELPG